MTRSTRLPEHFALAALRPAFAIALMTMTLSAGSDAHAQHLRLPAPPGLPAPALVLPPPVIVAPVVVAPVHPVVPPYREPFFVERGDRGRHLGHHKHGHKHGHKRGHHHGHD